MGQKRDGREREREGYRHDQKIKMRREEREASQDRVSSNSSSVEPFWRSA